MSLIKRYFFIILAHLWTSS